MTAELFAGTSGFAYPQWKPDFYPPKLPAKQFLQHYASRLNSVEINYTFRRTPSPTTVENWVNATPEAFRFSLKVPMRITHIHRLRNAKESTDFFLRAIDPLRVNKKLGVVLFQLPPQFRCDVDVLRNFLVELPHNLRYAFEFRHASWHDEGVYQLLRNHNACLCLAESEKLEAPEVITAVSCISGSAKKTTLRRTAPPSGKRFNASFQKTGLSSCFLSTKRLPRALSTPRKCCSEGGAKVGFGGNDRVEQPRTDGSPTCPN